MKKALLKILSTAFILSAVFTVAYPAQAYNPKSIVFDPGYKIANETQLGNESPVSVTAGIINWILGFLVLIAVVLVLYGGFIWMTSAGNEESIAKAKSILLGAIIGVVIILASYGVTSFVFNGLLNAAANGVG